MGTVFMGSSNDKYYRDVVILCNFPNYCRDFSFIFSERNADLKVRTAGTGTYIDGYIAPDLKIQDVEVHITKEMVLMDIGMISGILIIAVLVAGITIMKKRPKQILSEMS